jgi:hypothetical protein
MNKISEESIDAFLNARPYRKSNTIVFVKANVTVLEIFGNEIAYRYNDPERTISITNCGWKTAITKERLNAIPDVHITQKTIDGKRVWYLNGEQWDGKLIDVSSKRPNK